MHPPAITGTAYSYIRFSSRKQERGDSVRRQTELRDAWLARHPGVTLDTSLTLADLGVSAFRGKHRADDRTALSQFLRAVESGRVRSGSYLIVESLDRLTREELGDAFELVLGLVNRGVRIVQLSPAESILAKPVSMTALMLAVVELSRGNSESAIKSQRVGAAWADKQAECVASGKLVTKRGPAWLVAKGGRFEFRPGARELVRRIFDMVTAGHGCRAVCRILNGEKVPLWTGKPWYERYIRLMIKGREAVGEFHEERGTAGGGREAFGEPILNYYPRCVTEAEWQAAQVALAGRRKRGGRPAKQGDRPNIFKGLLVRAGTGERLYVVARREQSLVPASVKHSGERGASFPYDPFERGILSALKEIDPREILPPEDAPGEVDELAALIVQKDAQIRRLIDLADDGADDEVPELRAKIKARNAERKELVERHDRAKLKAATPKATAWGDCKGLIEVLDAAPDQEDVRVRLRQVLARIVDSITCLLAGKGLTRLAAVRIQFKDSDKHRDYVIHVRQPARGQSRPVKPNVLSFADSGLPGVDLRNPADAAAVEKLLNTLAATMSK